MLTECLRGGSGTIRDRGWGSRFNTTLSSSSRTSERCVTGELGTDFRRNGLRNMSTSDVELFNDCWVSDERFIGEISFSCRTWHVDTHRNTTRGGTKPHQQIKMYIKQRLIRITQTFVRDRTVLTGQTVLNCSNKVYTLFTLDWWGRYFRGAISRR